MSKRSKNRVLAFAPSFIMLGAPVAFAGCEDKGPAEKAGQSIDHGIQKAKDAVNPPGPGEKAGRTVDKAVKPEQDTDARSGLYLALAGSDRLSLQVL